MNTLRGVASLLFCAAFSLHAQSTNASMSGYVMDPSKSFIAGAKVIAINIGTNVRYENTTDQGGSYTLPNLTPGSYRIEVEKAGFKTLVKSDIVLHLQDAVAINFEMALGSTSELVTVTGGAPMVDTQSASVGLLVDHEAVENMPMNGRSFQSLINLTPGVTPSTTSASDGGFSVNGQRPDANNFMVDGVSANTGGFITPGVGIGGTTSVASSGSVGGLTALGTTQSLVSIDAMQEFRVQTSTYSAEYGRAPGGQISIVTRSGTNQYHGSAFDYFRNTVFDANNWFGNSTGQQRSPERQNDFGGTLGGPVIIPHLYDGRNKTFFFFSYEGLRLTQPYFVQSYVPSVALRQSAIPAMQPFLNAFPIPNGANIGNGLAFYNGSFPDQNSLDAASIRIDQVVTSKWTVFGRYNWAPSSNIFRSTNLGDSQAVIVNLPQKLYTTTVGATGILTPRLSNDIRFNYSLTSATANRSMDDIGGAVPITVGTIVPSQYLVGNAAFNVGLSFSGYPLVRVFLQNGLSGRQHQYNLTDTVSYTAGSHRFKFGVDWRRLNSPPTLYNYEESATFTSQAQAMTGTVSAGNASVATFAQTSPIFEEFSAFAQDTWKISSRLTMDLGLRWDLNPAPGTANGTYPLAVTEISNFAAMALQPNGTPVYKTTYANFAPRIGAAYQLRSKPGHETVIRSGFGVFYDTGNQLSTLGNSYAPNGVTTTFGGTFPFTSAQLTPGVPGYGNINPPYGTLAVSDPNLKLPYTLQWSLAVQQAFGDNQTFTLTYIGNGGRKLLVSQQYSLAKVNPLFTTVIVDYGGGTSSYNALQAQYVRRMSHNLQLQMSYTWSHAIDTASTDSVSTYPPIRGNSAYDLPQTFAGSLIYNIPTLKSNRFVQDILGHWSLDSNIHAQSGLPVNVIASQVLVPATGTYNISFPNVVPGQPLYLYGAACTASNGGNPCPGGMRFNPAAFTAPAAGTNGDLGRDVLRGLGAWQVDLALQRQINLTEKVNLLFRAESFNIFNHPDFGPPTATFGAVNFGLATNTLNAALPSLGSLYQTGAPRSFQLALKLRF
jgi:hypothetical protein